MNWTGKGPVSQAIAGELKSATKPKQTETRIGYLHEHRCTLHEHRCTSDVAFPPHPAVPATVQRAGSERQLLRGGLTLGCGMRQTETVDWLRSLYDLRSTA
ncbi:hypothetical protein [Sphingosinicella sp. BN140058]|uniref:hypothetical protein n=1 Tax=Sphingosinicella sp. BN140058 TaxID=1892855 RepID=UPI0010137794|nr:hypothetical protein [Sphingosinicella sp. BN140058]QAY78158.1 hypothetical protein ETR14_17710 [Sphingosinicella sp. BN140058]